MDNKLVNAGYVEVPPLLNSTNEDLFIGGSNLFKEGRIESIRVFQKLIGDQAEIDSLNDPNDHGLKLVGAFNQDIKPISNHLIVLFTLGRQLTSHLHIIHGGAIATLIDEYFVKVALPLTPDNFAVTASLEIKYLKPIKIDDDAPSVNVILDCFIVKNVENRKFRVKGCLRDVNGAKYCIGELVVVVPREKLA